MQRWRRALGCAIALACAVVGPAGTARGDDEPPPAPTCQRLGIIGDSLTVHSRAAIAERLTALGVTAFRIDGSGSRRIPLSVPAPYSGVKALRQMRAAGYRMDCYVVALGTNDIGISGQRKYYEQWIRQLLDEIGDHPVLWVNVTRPKLEARVELFNTLLTELGGEYRLTVADWRAAMADHAGWFAPDKVHPTPAGRVFRGTWVADQAFAVLFGGTAPSAPVSTCSLTGTLTRKSTGPPVQCLEERLEQLGYDLPSPPDGVFDVATWRAVMDVQRVARLPINGVVGARTIAALGLAPPA